MGKNSTKVNRINEILQETICTIEKSKEEIIEIVEHARFECKKIEEELDKIKEKVDEIIKEVDLLEIEKKKEGSTCLL